MPGGAAVAAVGAYSANKAAKSQSSAAKKAANAQAESGQASIDFQRESRDLAVDRLSPYNNFATMGSGAGVPGKVQESFDNFDWQAYQAAHPEITDPNQWYGHGDPASSAWEHYQMYGKGQGAAFPALQGAETVGGYTPDSPLGRLSAMLTPEGQMSYLKENPLFNIALDNVNRQSNNAFLGRGKVGDATGQLVNNAYLAGVPLLQNQTANLFNAVDIGQRAAGGQAATTYNTGANVGSTMEGIGNSRASGIIGAGNANAQGMYGIGNSLAQGIGAYGLFNNPAGAVNGGYVPTDYSGQTSGLLNGMSYGL